MGSTIADSADEISRSVDVDRFWQRGYVVVRNVFSTDEVARLRAGVEASTGPKSDLLANDRLRSVLTDGRLVSIARELLGSDEIHYAGDSAFTVDSNEPGYHKDCADRFDPNGPDWASRYTVVRFGIYLQDHRWHTNGLNVRVGSHEHADVTTGRTVYVRSAVGDVVVWSLRTTHSAAATLLRFPWLVYPTPWRAPMLRRFEAPMPPGSRIALFASMGLKGPHFDRYVDMLKTRTYMARIWANTKYSAAALSAAAAGGLTVRDVAAEIEGDASVGLNDKWQPLPY